MKRSLILLLSGMVLSTAVMCYVYLTFNNALHFDIELVSRNEKNTFFSLLRIILLRCGFAYALLLMRVKTRQRFLAFLPAIIGLKIGLLLSLLVKRYYINGMGLVFLLLFPQYIFYIMSYVLLHRENAGAKLRKRNKAKVFIAYFAGIITECFINPRIFIKCIDLLKI